MSDTGFEHLSELLRAYRKSNVLFTAFELGVFEKLSSHPRDINTIAKELRISKKGIQRLLSALCAMGIIKKFDKNYSISEDYQKYLDPLLPENIHGLINHEIHLYHRWKHLTECIESGLPIKKITDPSKPEDTARFINAMSNIGQRTAPILLNKVRFKGTEKLLDLGGGPGKYIEKFSEKYPDMQLTLFDQSETIRIAKDFLSDHKHSNNMTFIKGDLLENDFGNGYDVIFSSNVIHIFGPEEVRTIFDKSYQALNPGGRLLIKDFFLNDDYTGPEFASLFSLHMLLSTENGKCYSENDMISLMEKSGFIYKQSINLTGSSVVIEGIK